jgi:hypothetical protein
LSQRKPQPNVNREYGLTALGDSALGEGGADAVSRTIDTSRVRGIGTRRSAPYVFGV